MSATLRQVAHAAGLSLATVSRALAGSPRCSVDARSRAQAAAERLGYRPDPGVAALARRRHGGPGNRYPLAWICERLARLHGDRDLYLALRATAARRGYDLRPVHLPALGDPRQAGPALERRGFVGCFLPSLTRREVVEGFAWDRFCVVSGIQEDFALPFDSVRPDLFAAMFRSWEMARAAGFRRIGAVIPSSFIARENEVLLSACAYHRAQLPEAPPPLILQPDANASTAHYSARTVAWYRRHRPDLVIGKTSGAYWALREAGVRMPRDCAFLSLNQTEQRSLVAGFDWQREVLADAMMARMHTLISQGLRGHRPVPGSWLIEPRWRAGASCPQLAG